MKFCSRQSVYFNLNSFDSLFDILKKEKQLQVTFNHLEFKISHNNIKNIS